MRAAFVGARFPTAWITASARLVTFAMPFSALRVTTYVPSVGYVCDSEIGVVPAAYVPPVTAPSPNVRYHVPDTVSWIRPVIVTTWFGRPVAASAETVGDPGGRRSKNRGCAVQNAFTCRPGCATQSPHPENRSVRHAHWPYG